MKFLLLLFLTGCATILAPSHQTIKIHTIPSGKTIHVDGMEYTTPANVSMATDSAHVIKWPDGSTSQIEQTFQPWIIGNVIFGLGGIIIGVPIDLLSGAVSKNLTPRSIQWPVER